MYNMELKNRFLENYPKETAKTYKDSLMKVVESEIFYDKDIFNFNYEQLDGALKSIRAKTLSGVRRNASAIFEYIRWANQNGFVKTKIDITNLFSGDKLKDYVWKHAQLNSYISRETLFALCDRLVNYADKVILVLAFEGIDGKEHYEMRSLKFSNINFGTGKIRITNVDGEIREVVITDKRSLDIIRESENEDSYLFGNGNNSKAKKNEYDLLTTPFVIRKIDRSKSYNTIDDEMVSSGFIVSKITRFFKGLRSPSTGMIIEESFLSDCEFLNSTNIFKSGFFDYCMRLEEEKGELTTKDYQDACVRYGINIANAQTYKTQYLTWKENAK